MGFLGPDLVRWGLDSKQLSESLACPVVEYRGKLIASELPSPGNPCVKLGKEIGVQPPSEDAVFLFVGSNVAYSQKRGHWTVILIAAMFSCRRTLTTRGFG